jgi:hypothetical protein
MSRDHYRGVPKSRAAVISRDNKLKPLSVKHKSGGYGLIANSAAGYDQSIGTWDSQIEIFVRNTGNDNNDGLTEATAVKTLERVHDLLPRGDLGKTQYMINMTGYTAVPTEVDGTWTSGKLSWGPHRAFDGRNQDFTIHSDGRQTYFNLPLIFFAAPTLVLAITPTSSSTTTTVANQTTNIVEITVDETLTPDAHVGQFVYDSDGLVVYGRITANGTNTISISHTDDSFPWTSVDGIYTESCDLSYGDANLSNLTVSSWEMGCNVLFSGIKFGHLTTGSSSLSMKLHTVTEAFFILCEFDGLHIMDCTAPEPYFDGCHFTGQFALDASGVTCQASFFNGTDMLGHGDGGSGKVEYQNGCVFDGCSAIGGGNHEQTLGLEMKNCHILNGTGQGILLDSPARVTINSTYIENCASDAIRANVGGCYARIQDVHGSGNGGYGLYLGNGHQALLTAVGGSFPSVSGTSGEIRLGSKDVTWASGVPQTDADNVDSDLIEFCRIF